MNTRKLFVFGFFVALLAFPSFSVQAKEFVDASVSEAAYQLHREVGWGDGCIESFKKVPCQERPPTWGPAASKFKNLLHKKMQQQLNSFIKQVEFGEKADLSIIDKQIQKLDEFKSDIHASELEEPTDKYRYVNRIKSVQRDLKGQKKIVRNVQDSLEKKQQELKTKNRKLEELKQEKGELESKLANLKQKQEKKKANKETKTESKEASSSVFTWKQSTFVFAILFVLSLFFIWFRRPENNSEEFKAELEKKKEELEDAEKELEEVKNKKAHTEDELKVEKDKKQELEGELTEAHSKLERAEEKRKELETQLQEQKEEIDRLQQQTGAREETDQEIEEILEKFKGEDRKEKVKNLKQRLEKVPELAEKLSHAKTRIQELENKEANSADPSPQPNLYEESELEEEPSDLGENTADTAVAKVNDEESGSPNIHHLNQIENAREREETDGDMGSFHAHQEDTKQNIEPIGEGASAPEEQPPKDYDSPDGTTPGSPNPEESEEKNTKGQWEE